MNWHRLVTTLRRKAGSNVFRVVLCALVLVSSVAIVAVCVWDGRIWESGDIHRKTTISPKPTGPILFSRTQSISIDGHSETESGTSFSGEDSWKKFLPQDRDEAISIAFAKRMCFPPAVAIALRQMIDDPVNDRRDTMLHVACQAGDITMICFLIDAGADLNVTNRFGEKPLDLVDNTQRDYVEGMTRTIEGWRPRSPERSDSATHCG